MVRTRQPTPNARAPSFTTFPSYLTMNAVRIVCSTCSLRATQSTLFISAATILVLLISVSVGEYPLAYGIVGAVTYALFFKQLPVQKPAAKNTKCGNKFCDQSGFSIDQSTDRNDAAYADESSHHNSRHVDSLPPAPVPRPPPGLELTQSSAAKFGARFNPRTTDATNTQDCASVAQEACALQLATQGVTKAELESGMHLRDMVSALSRTPIKPREKHAQTTFQPQKTFPTDEQSLRTNMQKLAQVDPDRVLTAKKIAKLGFKSDRILQVHFQQFGAVEQVLVSHAVDKMTATRGSRVRPGNTGFVVMSTVEEAMRALECSEQTVKGIAIAVSTYQRRHPEQRGET